MIYESPRSPEGPEGNMDSAQGQHHEKHIEIIVNGRKMPQLSPETEPSLEALLGFVAVTNAQHGDDILKQLCLQCLVLFPEESLSSAEQLCSVLVATFGLNMSTDRVQTALDLLVSQRQVKCLPGTNQYVAATTARARIETRIQSARLLQGRVKRQWLTQCLAKFGAELEGQQAWDCLQQYLSTLFRRHGLQTVSLLDAGGASNPGHSRVLKSSLDDILADSNCKGSQRKVVEDAIHLFLSSVGSDSDRTKFIVQLADGAFSYYSLSAPPEVAARLQSQLRELTLFLDTNFLFGILGLHVNPFDAVSEELISVVTKNHLPFKLRYHEATLAEMHRTIVAITSDLKGRHWPQALSRAALRSPYVSSIERKFHEKNALHTVDPETFFQPFDHPDELLKDKGILIYRQPGERLEQRADLINHYQEFLATRHREKPYEAVDHDMTVLDCVRHQRSASASSLDAKGLIITCDTVLSRFDWQELRSRTELACTILPNQFLQLLRPFIPASPEFDKSFAESFAIAEFRTVSKSSEATSKLLSLLASYKDIKEETACALLANDLLLEKLKKSKDDRQFKEFVDAALAADNAQLLEELVAAKQQEERERIARVDAEKRSQLSRMELMSERDGLLQDKTTLEGRVNALTEELGTVQSESAASITRLSGDVTTHQSKASNLEIRIERIASFLCVMAALICSAVFIFASEYLIREYKWVWLTTHPNSYALRSVGYLAVTAFLLGMFRSSWRKYFWWGTVGFIACLLALLSLLGGPAQ